MTTATAEAADTQAAQEKFVAELPHAYVSCRQQHRLPTFAPTRNGRLPKGIYAIGPYADGTHDVYRVCESCGLILGNATDRNGHLLDTKPRRRYPKGYLAKGIGRISKRMAAVEGCDRIAGALIASARPAASEE